MPRIGGFQSFRTARWTIRGFEAMLWLHRGFDFAAPGRCAGRTGCCQSVSDFRRFTKHETGAGTIYRAAYARVCIRPRCSTRPTMIAGDRRVGLEARRPMADREGPMIRLVLASVIGLIAVIGFGRDFRQCTARRLPAARCGWNPASPSKASTRPRHADALLRGICRSALGGGTDPTVVGRAPYERTN